MEKVLNFIDNLFCDPDHDDWLEMIEPATGKVVGKLANSCDSDAEHALEAATVAFDRWSRTSAEQRSALMHRLADLVDQHQEELAQLESRDTGKPIQVARNIDIPRVSANLRFFAAAATQFSSESHDMNGTVINYTLRQPIGVAVCISPWNLPLYLLTWKIAPAIAAGNTVVAKPSEVTPSTANLFCQLVVEAGFPDGVINMIHGRGDRSGAALVDNDKCKVVSFTGSTRVGEWIASTCAPKFRKYSLEMGGKNPALVFADSDLDSTVTGILRASFANQGQICLCASRILIEDSFYEQFRDRLVEKARQLQMGDPAEDSTEQGALVSADHMEKVLDCIQTAGQEGGTILTGGKRHAMSGRCSDGFFVEPTIVEGLDMSSQTNQQEIFGPVVTLTPFSSESEAVTLANNSSYGLAATIWTADVKRAHRIAASLECGIVWVNCWLQRDLRTPFGGMKNSGVGREGGLEAMRFFTEPKNVCIGL